MAGEDSKYSEWIRSRPCCMCGKPPRSEQHHPRGPAFETGTGKRAHDRFSIPLCADCHRVRLHGGMMEKGERRGFEFDQAVLHRELYMQQGGDKAAPDPAPDEVF